MASLASCTAGRSLTGRPAWGALWEQLPNGKRTHPLTQPFLGQGMQPLDTFAEPCQGVLRGGPAASFSAASPPGRSLPVKVSPTGQDSLSHVLREEGTVFVCCFKGAAISLGFVFFFKIYILKGKKIAA